MKLRRGSFARLAIIAECIRLVRMDGTHSPHYGKMLTYRHRNYIAMWGSNEMPRKSLIFDSRVYRESVAIDLMFVSLQNSAVES